MARKYAATGNGTVGTNKTILGTNSPSSGNTTRSWVYDIIVGSDAAPNDLAGNFVVQRYTAAGTNTSVTPQALDGGNPAAIQAAGSNHSAEPTYTANAQLLQFGLNQRATFRWVAVPGGELVVPNTASNGIGIYTTAHGGTPTMRATFHWEE